LNEDQFKEQILNDLEKKGITCINLHGGIFDLYIPIFKKFIECKKITSFEHTPKMTDESGIKFTDGETDALRKTSKLQDYKDYKELPITAIMDDMTYKGSYYLIPPAVLKGYIIERIKFLKYMAISISHFKEPSLSYDYLLNELIKEVRK